MVRFDYPFLYRTLLAGLLEALEEEGILCHTDQGRLIQGGYLRTPLAAACLGDPVATDGGQGHCHQTPAGFRCRLGEASAVMPLQAQVALHDQAGEYRHCTPGTERNAGSLARRRE